MFDWVSGLLCAIGRLETLLNGLSALGDRMTYGNVNLVLLVGVHLDDGGG